jgi:cytochrome b561
MSVGARFTLFSRLLHWTMAAMIIAMLFIGVAMVGSLSNYHRLVSIHRPLGIAILILVVVRYVNRRINPPPPFLASMPPAERVAATISEKAMYAMMFAMPLIGWAMLSAARYPIVLYGPLHLPPILPHSTTLYVVLRKLHTIVAYLFFVTFIAHFSAMLFHTLIMRDRILDRMVPWRVRRAGTDSIN